MTTRRRPATDHALAQLIRHTRGCVTTIEKWIASTPSDQLVVESAEVIRLLRGRLTDLETCISTSRSSTAPSSTSTHDRPAHAARFDTR